MQRRVEARERWFGRGRREMRGRRLDRPLADCRRRENVFREREQVGGLAQIAITVEIGINEIEQPVRWRHRKARVRVEYQA